MVFPGFEHVEVLIWDFDRTLYKDTPEIQRRNRQGFYSCIAEQKSVSLETANGLFESLYAEHHSLTKVAQALDIPGEVMNSALDREDISDLLERDEGLINLFSGLQSYRHIQATRSQKPRWQRLLGKLGVLESTFEMAVCYEHPESSKGSGHAFRYIAAQTGLPPEKHLVIEDCKYIIRAAKKEGMKTIYVWGACPEADVSVPTVYGVQGVLQP
ncbi:HAD-IA family hydrolase [Candidatus Woesearchaeota archaeon]|nr:HAD-IA family hydrolase [Candidatus Woesearchaeota archaeon]